MRDAAFDAKNPPKMAEVMMVLRAVVEKSKHQRGGAALISDYLLEGDLFPENVVFIVVCVV